VEGSTGVNGWALKSAPVNFKKGPKDRVKRGQRVQGSKSYPRSKTPTTRRLRNYRQSSTDQTMAKGEHRSMPGAAQIKPEGRPVVGFGRSATRILEKRNAGKPARSWGEGGGVSFEQIEQGTLTKGGRFVVIRDLSNQASTIVKGAGIATRDQKRTGTERLQDPNP